MGDKQSKKEFLNELGLRASKNEGFKKDLLNDPKGVIEKNLQIKLPDELKIKVLEEKPDELYLVVPINEGEPGLEELSDTDLLQVPAGGLCWSNISCPSDMGP